MLEMKRTLSTGFSQCLFLAAVLFAPVAAAQPMSGTFSGSSVEGVIDVDGDGINGSTSSVAGTSPFGVWTGTTVAELGAVTGLCGSTAVNLEYHTWSTVQRVAKGDLIYYALDPGEVSAVCFDFVSQELTFEIHALITGGTGRFRGAAGRVTLTGSGDQLLADLVGAGVHSAFSGIFEGEIERSEQQ